MPECGVKCLTGKAQSATLQDEFGCTAFGREQLSKGGVPQSASQQFAELAVPPLESECPLPSPETRHGKPEHRQHERRLSPRDGDAASWRDEAALPVHHERVPRGADDLAQSASQRRPLDCRASNHVEGVPPSEGHGESQDPRQHGHNLSRQDGRCQGAAQDLRGDRGEHRREGHGWRDEARDPHEGHGLSGREDRPELRPPQGQDVPPGARGGQPVPDLGNCRGQAVAQPRPQPGQVCALGREAPQRRDGHERQRRQGVEPRGHPDGHLSEAGEQGHRDLSRQVPRYNGELSGRWFTLPRAGNHSHRGETPEREPGFEGAARRADQDGEGACGVHQGEGRGEAPQDQVRRDQLPEEPPGVIRCLKGSELGFLTVSPEDIPKGLLADMAQSDRAFLLEVACSEDSVLTAEAERQGLTAIRAGLHNGFDLCDAAGLRRLVELIRRLCRRNREKPADSTWPLWWFVMPVKCVVARFIGSGLVGVGPGPGIPLTGCVVS